MTETGNPLMKDRVDASVVEHYAVWLSQVAPGAGAPFDVEAFRAAAMDGLDALELKGRIRHLARVLHDQLGGDYLTALAALLAMLDAEQAAGAEGDIFVHWPMAQFVEDFGIDHLNASAEAMRRITEFASCEFAVRPFLVRYPAEMLAIIHDWAADPSVHVRRNASEGIRPRLPWGMRLNAFVADPTPVFEVLSKLRKDPEEYVRRSVSNCLNDIAKDHPGPLMDVLEAWDQDPDAHSLWVKKRALRTLVKAGDSRALALLGFGSPEVTVEDLSLDAATYAVGDTMVLSFSLVSTGSEPQELMVDYRVHYVKANGQRKPKVFKLKTAKLRPGERLSITRRQHLKLISTRRYHPGRHAVDVQVNGQPLGLVEFDLTT